MAKNTLSEKIEAKIKRSNREVFVRQDFQKLAGYDQVGRALAKLTKEGKLKKIGYGLYAKARLNRISGVPMLAAKGGFVQVAEEACARLKIKWERGKSYMDYEQRVSQQIPAKAEVIVSGRFSRKIGTDKYTLLVNRRDR